MCVAVGRSLTTMNIGQIEIILAELVSQPIGIQEAVLVSSKAQLLTKPISMDDRSTQIIAGTMLYLAERTRAECKWQEIEQISVRAQEGYIILASCNENVFLLIKASQALAGLLEGEVERTVTKLRTDALRRTDPLSAEESSARNPLWQEEK